MGNQLYSRLWYSQGLVLSSEVQLPHIQGNVYLLEVVFIGNNGGLYVLKFRMFVKCYHKIALNRFHYRVWGQLLLNSYLLRLSRQTGRRSMSSPTLGL